MGQDIVASGRAAADPYVVCGFFTPNYRPLAESLAADLEATGNPCHLFARERGDATWREIVRWKPEVMLEAMTLYPQSAIIMMDVDSSVRGPLTPMLNFVGDISARAKLRLTTAIWPFRQKTILHISSRSMVLKPNERARRFLADWRDELKGATYYQGGCEMAMRMVIMRSVGLAFCPMDPLYAGLEDDTAPPDAVVVHSSASARTGRK